MNERDIEREGSGRNPRSTSSNGQRNAEERDLELWLNSEEWKEDKVLSLQDAVAELLEERAEQDERRGRELKTALIINIILTIGQFLAGAWMFAQLILMFGETPLQVLCARVISMAIVMLLLHWAKMILWEE